MKKVLSMCIFVCLSFLIALVVACSNSSSVPTEADALSLVKQGAASHCPVLTVVSVKKTNGQLREYQGVKAYLMNVEIQFDCSKGGCSSRWCTDNLAGTGGLYEADIEFQQTEKGWVGVLVGWMW